MGLVLARGRGEGVVLYRSRTGKVDLDSVVVVEVAKYSGDTCPRLRFGANGYVILRTELLTRDNFNQAEAEGKSKLSRPEAERLRAHLVDHYEVEGLEQSLLNGEGLVE